MRTFRSPASVRAHDAHVHCTVNMKIRAIRRAVPAPTQTAPKSVTAKDEFSLFTSKDLKSAASGFARKCSQVEFLYCTIQSPVEALYNII